MALLLFKVLPITISLHLGAIIFPRLEEDLEKGHLLDPWADGGSCVFIQCGAPVLRVNRVLSSRASGSKGYICQGCCHPGIHGVT